MYGKPWPHHCPLAWELAAHGGEPTDNLLGYAERRLEELNALLSPEQRTAVANMAVFGFIPQWFYTVRLELRSLPQDERHREALLSALNVLAGSATIAASR